MKPAKWIPGLTLGVVLAAGCPVFAQGNSQGHGHGKGHSKDENHNDRDDDDYYRGYNHEIHQWYDAHQSNLPPGLAKKDRLPPGLEKQLVRNGSLPPGLQKRMEPCPRSLEHYLPPPPPNCTHVLIGGHIVLLNRKTNVVVDFLHVEGF